MNNNGLRFNTESALYEREIPFDGKDENGNKKVLYTAKIEMTVSDIEEMQALKLSKPVIDEEVIEVLKIILGSSYDKSREVIKSISNTEKGELARISQLMWLIYQDLIEHQKKTKKSTQSLINRQHPALKR